VGGVAAIAHGSSFLTRDFDALVPINEPNCERILAALERYDPHFYQAHGKPPVSRSARELAQFKNLYWETKLGVVDLLGTLPPIGDYAVVANRAIHKQVHGLDCLIISLDDLIEVKAFVGRPKDKMVEIELRAIRERLTAGKP
jgi:hypothetical protein